MSLAAEIEVSQRCALSQQSQRLSAAAACVGPSANSETIAMELVEGVNASVAEIEVSQLTTLPQHSCKPLCPGCSEI
jgi:hypothetical protein